MPEGERKLASETAMRALGLPVLENLPDLSPSFSLLVRSKRDIVDRFLALVAVVAHAMPGQTMEEELDPRRLGVSAALTPEEREFLARRSPSEEDRFHAATKMESLLALAWALQIVGELGPPRPADYIYATLMMRAGEFAGREAVDGLTLRDEREIVDAMDLHVRMTLTVASLSECGEELPESVDPVCAVSRAAALKWMVDRDADFDDTEICLEP